MYFIHSLESGGTVKPAEFARHKGGLSPSEQELPSGAPPCHRNAVCSDRGLGERRGPRLGRGASAASDPAVMSLCSVSGSVPSIGAWKGIIVVAIKASSRRSSRMDAVRNGHGT